MGSLRTKERFPFGLRPHSSLVKSTNPLFPSGKSCQKNGSGGGIGCSGQEVRRRARPERDPGLLQPHLRSPKGLRRLETGHRSLGSKQVSCGAEVFYGDCGVNQSSDSPTCMGDLTGSEGRVLPHPDSSIGTEVSAFQLPGSALAVPLAPVRSVSCPLDFHDGGQRVSGFGPSAINLSTPVPGRLGGTASLSLLPRVSDEDTDCLGPGNGFPVQLGKVRSGSQQGLFVPGLQVPDGPEPSFALEREAVEDLRSSQALSSVSFPTGLSVSVASGSPGCDGETGSLGKIALKGVAARSALPVATEFGPRLYHDHSVSQITSGYPVVAGTGQCPRRFPYAPTHSQPAFVHGCFHRGVGCSLGLQRGLWPVGFPPQDMAHQQPRARSCSLSPPTLGSVLSEPGGVSGLRQFDGGLLHQQAGGDSLLDSLQTSRSSAVVVPFPRHDDPGQAYPWQAQRFGRQSVPEGPDSSFGMVPVPSGLLGPVCSLGQTDGGLVRYPLEQQAASVCVSDPGSVSLEGGRSVHELGGSVWLRLPSHGGPAAGAVKDFLAQLQDPLGSSSLAGQALVSGPPRSPDRCAQVAAPQAQPVEAAPVEPVPQVPRAAQPSRLAAVEQSLREKGFSAEVSSRISQPSRQSTLAVYQSKWAVFSAWCGDRETDPLQASSRVVADFLLEKFEKGLAPSTLEGYRTAIAKTLVHLSGVDLGSDKDLSSLLNNFKLTKPSTRNRCPDWDLSMVLNCLTKAPFEPLESIPLKLLTWKCIFLLTLASGKRRSEIHSISFQDIAWTSDKSRVFLKPIPSFLAKTQLASGPPTSFSVPSLGPSVGQDSAEDLLLCPVRCLMCYMKRTKGLRGDRRLLFLSYKKGFKKDIRAGTVSSWIKKCILTCLDIEGALPPGPFKVRAHDVRALSASLAYNANVPLERVLEACTWATHNTFTSFYLRDVTLLQENLVRLGPLVLGQSVVVPAGASVHR